jgi:hypothetical protein
MNIAKKSLSPIAVLVVILAMQGILVANEGDTNGGQVTLHGEILDMACFVAHEAKGSDHAACAKRCVKAGQPMGLLTDDGTVYLLYASHDDSTAFDAAKEHAGHKVMITGKKAEQSGILGIEVHAVATH